MDIYQCLTCGQQWPHGGMESSYQAVAQHIDEMRHAVVIGERHAVEAQYVQAKAGVDA